MSQALYRKYRPHSWDEVVGQPHVVQTLRNALLTDRVAHAYLFAGPRGTGKTTAARLLAKAVNCLEADLASRPCNQCAHCQAVNENRFMDLIEIDAASNTSVDDVRDLRDKINFSPSQGRYKVYIVDEVHMLSTAAFNALLKTLEEPPPHAIFVLATTEIHKIPATVLSRCQRHEFRRVPLQEIVSLLEGICQSEGLDFQPEALTLIARQATGSVRDAISLLDQLASAGGHIRLDLAETVLGTATSETVLDLVEALRLGEPAAGMQAIHRALDGGSDPRALARQVVDYLRAVMLVQMGNADQVETGEDVRKQLASHARAFDAPAVLRMIRAFNAAAVDPRSGWQPSLGLELALAEAVEPDPAPAAPSPKERPTRAAKSAPAPAAPERKSAPAEPAPAESAPAVDVTPIVKAWRQIVKAAKPHDPSLNGLLNSCKLMGYADGALLLGFQGDVLVSKMTEENIALTSRLIEEITGIEIAVRCVVADPKRSAPANIKQDGMVATALQSGGEIVDIQD